MNDEKLRKNIIKVLIFFCTIFLVIIVYLSYFEVKYGEKLVADPNNRRNKDKEYEVLRGSIYDRAGSLIADSVRQEDGTPKRVYRKGYEMAMAPVLGYYSIKYGTSGLEKAYTKDLLDAGTLNPFKLVQDLMAGGERKGNSLVLTIDAELQKAAYDALGNNRGAVIAMDPKTGEILCMVSKPTFNPVTIDIEWENLSKQQDRGVFLNRAVQPGLYPPGSTFKIIVASEALESIEGIESKIFQDNGTLKIDNYVLTNFNGEKHGNINIHDALVVSSNVVFGQIGMELGVDRLREGAEKFLFNSNIDFDLAVAQSRFPSLDPSRRDSLAQSAIGQHDVTVTPLQMLLAASAIANDGVMMKPYLVKSITDPYGWNISTTAQQEMARPISKETADRITDMMIDVVNKGTGKNARIPGLNVAGKTGTAEVGEGQSPHSWFVAFAPADDPQIAISIIVENGETGGGKAASISKNLIKSYLNR